MPSARAIASTVTFAAVLALTGCGSGDAGTASTTTPSADASASPPAGGGFDQGQLDEIRECLDAAGLEDVFPTDMPTDMPSDMPTDIDPENLPEGSPSEGAGGGGGFGALQDPEVQDALDACGIELPQPPTPSEG